MVQGQGEAPRRCPRCGGLMTKPSGSSLYWHADNNHPRCDITNIIDPPLVTQTNEEVPPPANDQTKGKYPKK